MPPIHPSTLYAIYVAGMDFGDATLKIAITENMTQKIPSMDIKRLIEPIFNDDTKATPSITWSKPMKIDTKK